MEKIPPHNLYMYLHSLSKVFYLELSLVSWLHQKFPPLTYIYSNKTRIRKVLILTYSLIVGVGLNFDILTYGSNKATNTVHPFIIVVLIISLVLNIFWVCAEVYYFRNKCKFYYPQKNIFMNGKLNYVYYTSSKKNLIQKELTLKTMKVIKK